VSLSEGECATPSIQPSLTAAPSFLSLSVAFLRQLEEARRQGVRVSELGGEVEEGAEERRQRKQARKAAKKAAAAAATDHQNAPVGNGERKQKRRHRDDADAGEPAKKKHKHRDKDTERRREG
jgi:hypothetical protein